MPELIDRQAALEIAMSYCPDDDGCCSKAGRDIREMLDEIESLPNVHIDDMTFKIQNEIQAAKPSRTVEITFVRRGRWIPICVSKRGFTDTFECSECGRTTVTIYKTSKCEKAYCWNCGARMDATDTNVGGKGGADNG